MARVILIAVLSADGLIACHDREGTDWSSAEDKRLFVQLTRQAGVVVMGAHTFATIGKPLPGRRNVVYAHRAVNADGVETTQESPAELVTRLGEEGFEEIALIGGQNVYDQFMQAGLVNEMYLTIEPVVFGKGLSLLRTPLRQTFRLEDVEKLNADTVVLHYVG